MDGVNRQREEQWLCPVCGAVQENHVYVCEECGYDRSADYEVFRTFVSVEGTPAREKEVVRKFKQKNPDGSIIIGEKVKGVWNGPFVKKYPSGSFYVGTYVEGKAQGELKYVDKEGKITLGQWHGDGWNGPCREFFPGGSIMEGEKKNNLWDGEGKYVSADGSVLTANWQEGRVVGKGKISYKNGAFYEGEIEDFRAAGKGMLRLPGGAVLEGVFAAGVPKGQVWIRFPHGGEYRGEWRGTSGGGGVMEGTGRFCGTFDGSLQVIYFGKWRKNAMDDSNGLLEIYTAPGEGVAYRGEIKGAGPTGRGVLYSVREGVEDPIDHAFWNKNRSKSRAVREAEKLIRRGLSYMKVTLIYLEMEEQVTE